VAGFRHCFFGALEVVVDSRVPPLLCSVVALDFFPADPLSFEVAFFVGFAGADEPGAGESDEVGASTWGPGTMWWVR
jgi:hypothetical protein